MISISKQWNTDENYWILHPQMKTIKAFKALYTRDKKKDKSVSSTMMWAVALLVDPHEQNPWRNTNPLDRKDLIAEDYLGDIKFPWEDADIELLISTYKEFSLSVGERALIELEDKIADRGRFIAGTSYSMDEYNEESGKITKGTADQLDKMMINSIKIFEQVDKIKELIGKESLEGQGRGGAVESAGEQGLM
jgi:hypothetical protein|tara:strand:- start:1404 stop:1982 length:579 start_codon:yes stop_codon:yes gene_type:complete